MTKDKVIDKMIEAIDEMISNGWSKEAEREVWDMALAWNSEHDDEIFMQELDEGLAIEDDVFYFDR